MARAGRFALRSPADRRTASTLHYYCIGGSAAASAEIDAEDYADFIAYVGNLGFNSSFTVSGGAVTDAVIRFPSNAQKLENNTVALTQAAFAGTLTLHANSTPNSNAAGADGFLVQVATFGNLRYVLKRAVDIHGEFVPVNASGAQTIGTGEPMRLMDASQDRPRDKAFYRISVSLP